MALGSSARTADNGAAGCLGYLALALFVGFCWLAWTNRPIALWCIAALVIAAVAEGVRDKAAKEQGLMMRLWTAFAIGVRNFALGVGLSAGIGWIVQIVLNVMRDRADPTAILDVEARMYDLSAALETSLSARIVITVVLGFVIALATNSWAAVRWVNRGKVWLSWASVIVASAATITFVVADEGSVRQQFALGPIRASIGTDLTRLRDARRRKVAAQWLAAEIYRDLPDWQRVALNGRRVCAFVNGKYREEYLKQATKANPSRQAEPGTGPCADVQFAIALANAITPAKMASKASPSNLWLADEFALSGGEPSAAQPSADGEVMLEGTNGADEAPVTGPTPLSREALSLSIAQARIAANRVKKKADNETAAAAAWENAASSALSSLAGEMDHDFRAALIKSWIDTLAERVAAESGDAISERLKIGSKSPATPRDTVALLGQLPRVVFPIAITKTARTTDILRSTLSTALARYLPNGNTTGKLAILASTALAEGIARDTGKPANIYDAKGHLIGTAEPPVLWHPWTNGSSGPGRERAEPPRPEFHGIP